MKRFLLSIPLIASLFIFTSCGDSHEKLMDDQLSYIEEMTDIIDDVAEGKLSSSQGAEEIKEWGKKGAKLMALSPGATNRGQSYTRNVAIVLWNGAEILD